MPYKSHNSINQSQTLIVECLLQMCCDRYNKMSDRIALFTSLCNSDTNGGSKDFNTVKKP